MSITELNSRLLVKASDTTIADALAMIIENDNMSMMENVAVLRMQQAVKQYMNNCAPATFATVTKYNGNPVYENLVLTYTFPTQQDEDAFESEYQEFLAQSWTFLELNKITLTRNHIPYPNAESLLSNFILFED